MKAIESIPGTKDLRTSLSKICSVWPITVSLEGVRKSSVGGAQRERFTNQFVEDLQRLANISKF